MTLDLLTSLPAPVGQTAITAAPPLRVRGALNTTNLTYSQTALTNQHRFTLAPQGQTGSEIEVVLGLNRPQMTAAADALYAGILRFADTGGRSQIDVPVSATVANTEGLWVGQASITQVGHYLKTYELDANGQPVLGPIGPTGAAYIVTATNTSLGSVPRAFPLRLILHQSAAGTNVSLLQRVYYGQRSTNNIVVATRESLLDSATIGTARRISAAHLPFSHTNTFWPRTRGQLGLGTNLVFNVTLDYNDQVSNPFLHTFHPDHDNLKTDFRTVEAQGNESYRVEREITLTFTAVANPFASLSSSGQTLGGEYSEVVTVSGRSGHTRQFTVRGTFSLNRISPIATLTTE
jgi:hypothetical protein